VNKIKRFVSRFPVATLTTIVATLTTADAVGVWTTWLTPRQAGSVMLVLTLLSLVLGKQAHAAVTPVVDPRASNGVPLVPITSVSLINRGRL
jgi:hypothetical protein